MDKEGIRVGDIVDDGEDMTMDDWNALFTGHMEATPFIARALQLDDGVLTSGQIRQKIQAEVDSLCFRREPATPLEELCAEIGLINVTKRYGSPARERIPHDFRWTAPVEDLMFDGEPVLQLVFPPAKVDLIPLSLQRSLALRDADYKTITGRGNSLFMGALPASPDMMAIFMVVTPTRKEFFVLSRTSIMMSQGPVAAWVKGGATFFSAQGVEWAGNMSDGDNIVLVDGDMWYYPAEKKPTVVVAGRKVLDRMGRELVEGYVDQQDGQYTYDVTTGQMQESPIRPPVSRETFQAWKKIEPMPRELYKHRVPVRKFEMDVAKYDPKDRQALIDNPRLRSPTMMRRRAKYREQRREQYLGVCSDVLMFSVWECAQGNVWSGLECVSGRQTAIMGMWRLELDGRCKSLYMPVGREMEFYRAFKERYGRFRIVHSWLVGVLRDSKDVGGDWRDFDSVATRRQQWWREGYREVQVEISNFVRELF